VQVISHRIKDRMINIGIKLIKLLQNKSDMVFFKFTVQISLTVYINLLM